MGHKGPADIGLGALGLWGPEPKENQSNNILEERSLNYTASAAWNLAFIFNYHA
jgi:hypothetical protein